MASESNDADGSPPPVPDVHPALDDGADPGADLDPDDQLDDELDDRGPYTLQRFLRELAVALAILVIGVPAVLLATGGDDSAQLAQAPAFVPPPSPSRSAAGSPTPSAAPAPSTPAATGPSTVPSADASSPAAAEVRPVLVFAGSSLLNDARRVVDELAHGGQALTAPGAGYATGSPSLTNLLAETDFDPEHDAVVVQGGEADAALPDARLDLAAQQFADRIRLKFSISTSIVYIGPLPGALPEADLLRVRDIVEAAARAKSVHFLDPVALGWTLSDSDLVAKMSAAIAPFLDKPLVVS